MAQFDPNDPAIYAQLFGQAPPQGTSFVPPQVPQAPQAPVVPTDPYAAMVLGVEADQVGPQPENAMWTPNTPQEEATTAEWRPGMEKPVYTEMGAGSVGGGQSQSSRGSTSSTTSNMVRIDSGTPGKESVADEQTRRRAGNLLQVGQGMLDANQSALEAGQAVNQQAAHASQKMAKFDQITAEEMAIFDAEANEEATRRVQGITNAVDAVKSMKVDPTRLWSKPGSMQNVAGIAAAFMGGFLQPVLGTNTAQQIIDNAIDRDINAQQSDIQNAQRNVGNLKMLHSLGLEQADTEARQRAQQKLLMRAGLAGHLQAEALKLQDPVLAAKYEQEAARLNAETTKEIERVHAEERDRSFDQRVKNRQLRMAEHREKRESQSQSWGQARQEKMDAAASGAMEAEWRQNLVPIATGFTHTDGRQIHLDTEKKLGARQRQSVDEKSMKLQGQGNLTSALLALKPGRLSMPKSAERQMAVAVANQLLLSQGEALGRMTDKDMEILKQVAGGDLDTVIRSGGEESFQSVIRNYKNNVIREGQDLADTIGDDIKFQVLPDERYIAEFMTEINEAPKEVNMTKEQHAAKFTAPDLSPQEKAAAIEDFLDAGTGGQETLLLTPNDPVVRQAIQEYRALPDAVKKKRREGVQGNRRVYLGEDIGEGLEALRALGGAKHRRMLDAQKKGKKEKEEAANQADLYGGVTY